MAHASENSFRLRLRTSSVGSATGLKRIDISKPKVFLFTFPLRESTDESTPARLTDTTLVDICAKLHSDSTICVLASAGEAAILTASLSKVLEFRHWIVVKTATHPDTTVQNALPNQHSALIVFTRYPGPLKHTKTRIKYQTCDACGKTTKDYGGKRHLYHDYGTSISDVWRDIEWNPQVGTRVITQRLQDLFGLHPYKELRVVNIRETAVAYNLSRDIKPLGRAQNNRTVKSTLIHGDCLEVLRSIKTNSLDFCFADHPYNLRKKYYKSNDNIEVTRYFEWCDSWLAELFRVLKPGRTLAILNIPLWASRHFEYLSSIMVFQNWIAWDSLSFPVRNIMPAHYGIVCFSKGEPRPLPGLTFPNAYERDEYLSATSEPFCHRAACASLRITNEIEDRVEITDLWYDIFRLMHNSRRVSHPCQLPPLLMRRLFALFTRRGELTLDCFNGAGTSSLVAAEMGRRYIGIEISKRFHNLAAKRQEMLANGIDPFDKNSDIPTVKNSALKRVPKQTYEVSKKALQLDVLRIAIQMGRLPTREDVINHSAHPIDYFQNYFRSWSEVCAAARLATEASQVNAQTSASTI